MKDLLIDFSLITFISVFPVVQACDLDMIGKLIVSAAIFITWTIGYMLTRKKGLADSTLFVLMLLDLIDNGYFDEIESFNTSVDQPVN